MVFALTCALSACPRKEKTDAGKGGPKATKVKKTTKKTTRGNKGKKTTKDRDRPSAKKTSVKPPKTSKVDLSVPSKKGNTKVPSFRGAKKKIMEVFEGHESTFYCDCEYAGKKVDFGSCNYKVRKNKSRAGRIEIEHVVPASHFGALLPVWTEGDERCVSKGKRYKGRRCAEKVSKVFQLMQADLYNLQPAVGEVNGDRSNKVFGEVPGEPRVYGRCDMEITDKVAEPPKDIRGDIARTYFYMNWAYPGFGIVNGENRKMLAKWDKSDPVDAWERERVKRVQKVQGNKNPFVK